MSNHRLTISNVYYALFRIDETGRYLCGKIKHSLSSRSVRTVKSVKIAVFVERLVANLI